jgi:hypothetical protein
MLTDSIRKLPIDRTLFTIAITITIMHSRSEVQDVVQKGRIEGRSSPQLISKC